MTKLASENPATSLLEDLYKRIDESIDSMSAAELKTLEKKRKKIMSGVKHPGSDEGAEPEIDRRTPQALRA